MTKPSFVYVTYIRTSPEKLWQALTDGSVTRQYWAGRRVESDWTVGAPVTFWFDGKVSDSGKVLECDPPRRLSYSFHVEFVEALRSEPPSRVTFEIEKLDAQVKLTVTHDEFEPGSQGVRGHFRRLAGDPLRPEEPARDRPHRFFRSPPQLTAPRRRHR